MVAPCCLPCLWLLSVLCTLTQPIGTQRDTDTSDRSDSIGWLSFALINLHAANLALTRDQRGEPLLGANVPIPTTTPARGHAKTLENTGSLAIRKGPKTVAGEVDICPFVRVISQQSLTLPSKYLISASHHAFG